MTNKFVHFRVQSSYSMLESSVKVEQVAELAKQNKMSSVCLSDRGNLFASLEFALAACKQQVQPIHGSILNILFDNQGQKDFAEILLIAKDKVGYRNLLQLVSLTFTKNDRSIKNHITFEDLSHFNEGLIILSGYAEGVIGKLLLANAVGEAANAAKKLKQLAGDRFYFEIMRHGLAQERQIEAAYLQLATKLEIPLLATNQVLFGDISMHDAHDVLICISDGVVRDEQNRRRVSNQCYFKSADEMASLFSDLPEAIENTVHLAKRCYVMAEVSAPGLPNFSDGSTSEEEILRLEARKGLEVRLQQKLAKVNTKKQLSEKEKQEYFQRLDYELEIICKMNFAGYFLIVSDFIKWSKANGIAVGPGRGSGAGSIIAWTLQITDLDPIEFGLLFERFLNPERVSMPDFDIDFCQERREEVIAYVRSKYGDDRVAQIITFGKMQAKAVIKDVSRVLGLKYSFANYLTELVPFNAINPVTLSQAIGDVAELKRAYEGKGLYNLTGEEELIQQVLTTSLILEGLHRHASTHAAGVVIANQSLTDIVPVYKDTSSDMLIVQYSMKYAELAGLVKFDFLGLQTLTIITKTLALLQGRGVKVDIDTIPYDDKPTFEMLSQGLSTGVFQFESVGMKSALRRLGPENVDDLIALGALYRPGPMDNIPTYIACKNKEQEVDYLHPLLEPILKTTHGVIIYQEQVMEIARKLSGYSLGAADLLRRAMGKKVKSEMDAQEEIFVSGAVKNNVQANQAKSIFATVAKFAGYGFNKAHASAYGVISYQTAYLKANYPAEFLVACLNLDIDNSDKINVFLQDAKNFAIEVASPDINSSQGLFSIADSEDKKSIIFALGAIKNVTVGFGQAAFEARKKNGNFRSIIDFVERIDPKLINKRLLESIIKAGCFDSLHPNRNSLLQSIPRIMSYSVSYHEEQRSNQFNLISVGSVSSNVIIEADPISATDLAYAEFEVLGLFLKNHPLSSVVNSLEKCNVKTSDYIKYDLPEGTYQCKLAGVITKKDARMSQRGRFVTLILSDPYGTFEVTIYNEEIFKNYAHLLNIKEPVIVYCDISKDRGGLRVTATRFASVEEELQGLSQNVLLYPSSKEEISNILDILSQKKVSEEKNNSSITLFLPAEGDFVAKVIMPPCFYLEETDIEQLKKRCSI
ncbi:MAG: DNA polymerase III subunit alpha [Rickettsiaceae bacterium]